MKVYELIEKLNRYNPKADISFSNIPPYNGITAAPAICPKNLYFAGIGFKSSNMPVIIMMILPIKTAFI